MPLHQFVIYKKYHNYQNGSEADRENCAGAFAAS